MSTEHISLNKYVWNLNPLQHSIYVASAGILCILPTVCLCFSNDSQKEQRVFPKTVLTECSCDGYAVSFLCEGNWIFKCYIGQHEPQASNDSTKIKGRRY
jgi:hypothetical protein